MTLTDKEIALKKAENICANQEKCKADIIKKLYEWKVEAKYHTWILNNLENDKFIDEKRYAGFFVRDKFKFNKWGKNKIVFELRTKHIEEQIISEAIGTIALHDYTETCKLLLKQKLRSFKSEEYDKMKGKLLRFGIGRGFETEMVYRLTEKLLSLQKMREE